MKFGVAANSIVTGVAEPAATCTPGTRTEVGGAEGAGAGAAAADAWAVPTAAGTAVDALSTVVEHADADARVRTTAATGVRTSPCRWASPSS